MGEGSRQSHLYLVDGTSQLFRAYYAIRGLSGPDGLPTNAVYGFTTMLRKLLNEEAPPYIAVAFDLPAPTFRHERYSEYKAHRPPAPEDLNVQVPFAKEVCHALHISVLELPGYEADDLIATYTRLAREAGFEVTVVAADKDLLQLVGDGVAVLNPSRNVRLDADAVAESFGVPPGRVKDVLGLMGDSVDNIPGVPGVGEKTALAMVGTYGSLDEVLDRARGFVALFDARDALMSAIGSAEKEPSEGVVEEVARAAAEFRERLARLEEREADPAFRQRLQAVRELLDRSGLKPVGPQAREVKRALADLERGSARKAWTAVHHHAPQALLSRDLATLNPHVPAHFDPSSLEVNPPDLDRLRQVFERLGFRTLLAEISSGKGVHEPTLYDGETAQQETVLTKEALLAVVSDARVAGRLAVAVVAEGEHPLQARLVGIALAPTESRGVYLPLALDSLASSQQLPRSEVRESLGSLLADPSVKKIGHDIKRDLHLLRREGLDTEGWEMDTMVAAFLLDPGRANYPLDRLAEEFLRRRLPPGDGRAAAEARAGFVLAGVLRERLAESGLDALYDSVDGPLLPILAGMEARGIRVDPGVLESLSGEMEEALSVSRRRIQELAGAPLNPDSPKQLREVLFQRLGLKARRKTAKGGVESTDAATLEELAPEHEIAREVLAYRELAKLKGTYADTLPLLIHPATGRIHTSYDPTGAATGRLSSSEPNLQNIPVRTGAGRKIRSAFVPEPGFLFLSSDYSQVELRVLAHLSQDAELLAAFRAGEDIHRHTASRVFGVAPELVTEEMRRRAKAVNFGILYGMSETRLSREQGISRAEARRFVQAYFQRFRGVETYIERVRQQASREGQVRTLFGRVRSFPQLLAGSGRAIVEQALRAAVNSTIQGTAADLMKMAMIRVDRELADAGLSSRMLLQVHDELLFEVPEAEVAAARSLVRGAMENVHPLEVPLVVDQKVGHNWTEVT